MPILYAELQIAGRQVACQVASFSFEQPTDAKGRPNSTVRTGLLKVVVVGEAAGWHLWEEIKFNPYRRESGHLVFFKNVGQTAKRYTFYDAALVWLQFRYDGKGTAGKQTATQVELHFSAATIELDGIRLDAYGVIPWETNPQASFRALSKPPAPLPSAHLAAGMGVVSGRLAAAAAGVLKKALPIAGEGAARTISLLPGMLLASVNANADPAKDADWQLYHRNHAPAGPIPPPPKPDEFRLAELERTLAAQTLTAQEEAELIILLAKVKSIHVQRLSELNNSASINDSKPSSQVVTNKFPEEPMPSDGKIVPYQIDNGNIKGVNGRREFDFIIDDKGKLVIGNKHHALGRGRTVQAAGQLRLNGKGQIRQIDNLSGHYQPTVGETANYPHLLQNAGLNVKGATIVSHSISTNATGMVTGVHVVSSKIIK